MRCTMKMLIIFPVRIHWALAVLTTIGVIHTAETHAAHPDAKQPVIVNIDAFQYQPDIIKIQRGQSIIFMNRDDVPHTVTPGKNARFISSGLIKGGEQHEVKFESTGIQDYSCDFHPSMQGQVQVQ